MSAPPRPCPVATLDEALTFTLRELRADIIRSAAQGQGPTFIAAKLDMLIGLAKAEDREP